MKLAGGQGDHEISRPVGSIISFFFSEVFEAFGRNPWVLIFFIVDLFYGQILNGQYFLCDFEVIYLAKFFLIYLRSFEHANA